MWMSLMTSGLFFDLRSHAVITLSVTKMYMHTSPSCAHDMYIHLFLKIIVLAACTQRYWLDQSASCEFRDTNVVASVVFEIARFSPQR
jgi:hypothetical protein